MRLSLRSTVRLASRAAQVAVVGDLDQQCATVLFMIRADSAVVRAAVSHCCIGRDHLLGRLDESFSRKLVIADVIGHQYPFRAMLGTAFQHPHATVLKDNFGIYAQQADAAERNCGIVVLVRSSLGCHLLDSGHMMRGLIFERGALGKLGLWNSVPTEVKNQVQLYYKIDLGTSVVRFVISTQTDGQPDSLQGPV